MIQLFPRRQAVGIRPVGIEAAEVTQRIRPESARQVGTTEMTANVFIANSDGPLSSRILVMSVTVLASSIKADGGVRQPGHCQKFMQKVFWIGPNLARLRPYKVDPVDHNHEIILFPKLANRNRVLVVNVSTISSLVAS